MEWFAKPTLYPSLNVFLCNFICVRHRYSTLDKTLSRFLSVSGRYIYIITNSTSFPRVLFVQTDWNFFPICAILLRKFEALGGNKDERKQLLWELQKRMSDYAPALGFSACPWDKARWGQIVAFSNQRYQPSSLSVLPKDTYPVLLFSCFCFGSYCLLKFGVFGCLGSKGKGIKI